MGVACEVGVAPVTAVPPDEQLTRSSTATRLMHLPNGPSGALRRPRRNACRTSFCRVEIIATPLSSPGPASHHTTFFFVLSPGV